MLHKILIITALKDELPNSALMSESVVFCGVGKLNACTSTLLAIQDHKPDLILNFGTVGRINQSLGGLIEIKYVIQRDMITEPLAPRGTTPFSTEPNVFSSEFGTYKCGTGDSFVTNHDLWLIENQVDVVDMELFGIAKIANQFGIPWRSFKYITDDANHESGTSWQSHVNQGEVLFLEALKNIRTNSRKQSS